MSLGIPKLIGYLGALLAFIIFSMLIFARTKFPEYIYLVLALSIPSSFSDEKRNTFLKTCYSKSNYQKLRIIENLITVLPFFLFLVFKQKYLIGLSLVGLAPFLSLFSVRNTFNLTIPTPFYKYPYEFTEGFRKSFLVFVFFYTLIGIAIRVNNFNLGAVCILFGCLTSMGFYLKPEPYFYVWVFSNNAKTFIFNKIKIAIFYTTIICLPMTVPLSLFSFEKIHLILGFQLLGYLFVITGLLSKYSAFPSEITLKKALSLLGSIAIPPLMLVTIPVFYIQSIKRLKSILE